MAFTAILFIGIWVHLKIISQTNSFVERLTIYHDFLPTSSDLVQQGELKLLFKHSPKQLFLEYGLTFISIVLSLGMAMSMCQVSRAVHNFANLEKLMGSFIQKVSQNNGNDWTFTNT